MDINQELMEIKGAIAKLKEECPGFRIYVTASKEFNAKLLDYLWGSDYKIWLRGMFDTDYSVSPFIDNNIQWMVWLFDYSQILGLWNSQNDNQYKLSHLFDKLIVKNAEKEEGWDIWENSND